MSTPTHQLNKSSLFLRNKATAKAPANIAFIKYWGKADAELNLPLTDTISMNLSACLTTTTVEFNHSFQQDKFTLNRQKLTLPSKLVNHLDRIRRLAHIKPRAKITSSNNFPAGTGIASSASGFAALTLAAAAAADLKLSALQLSALARAGSGSAARSIPTGFVVWEKGHDHASSFASSLYPPHHWHLIDVIAIVSSQEKTTTSTDGHQLASTSPYFKLRLKQLPHRIIQVGQALKTKNLQLLGETIETEAIDLHLIAMSSQPPVFYWEPATLQLIKLLPQWRSRGLPVYFTLDAGPNPHLITEAKYQVKLLNQLHQLKFINQLIVNRVGEGARLIPNPRS